MEILQALAIGIMFGIGIFQILRRNVIRAAMGMMILTNAVNLFLLSTGAYNGMVAAYTNLAGLKADALPQAVVLTAIVISLAGFSFVLALLYVLSVRLGTADADEINRLKH